MRTSINLRGLGTQNTLVLVNGRRLARTGTMRNAEGYDLAGIPDVCGMGTHSNSRAGLLERFFDTAQIAHPIVDDDDL